MKPPQIVYRYIREDFETFEINGEKFVRDYELERTILKNNLLWFPKKFYDLPLSAKRRHYDNFDIGSAFKYAVEFEHKFSWESLEKDYGIPKKYIDAWRKQDKQ